ncbi:MAG: HD domain-containing protein [Chromatiales bacterium]|nr:HD domain-containing protein [Chromatiales bacterium]
MTSRIGSYDWSESTNGLLSRRDKARVFGMLLRSQLAQRWTRILRSAGAYERRLARVDLDHVAVPDSAIVREAERVAERLYSRDLYAHCQRTFAFGMLLGQFHRAHPDPERLYLGCLFHDFGLTRAHAAESECCGFELVGARQARHFAHEHGWSERHCRSLYESISLHLNPWLSMSAHEAEAALLQRGAMLDVIGADRHLIPLRELDRVQARHPRDGFRAAILASMTDIRHPPDSRAGFLFRCGFACLAGNNPLDMTAEVGR